MHCGGCERAVEAQVRRIAGVASAKADYKSATLRVESQQALDSEDVRRAVQMAGYKLISVKV